MTDHDPPTTPLRAGRRAPRGRRRAVVLVAALLLVATVPAWWSVGSALAVPGSDSVAARLAEWGRDHGLGGVLTCLEGVQYQLNPPPLGGNPGRGIPRAAAPPPAPPPRRAGSLSPPAPLTPLAGAAALPGEGVWQTVSTVRGLPAVRVAYLCVPTPCTLPRSRV